ncbi:MAG: DUF1223 domain-containing protein [Rhodobacterales bacterium 32-67-9]|nr:MAG: DUF1223 domain-containing protein [Rhodobacterales bacterium 32-67-9]
MRLMISAALGLWLGFAGMGLAQSGAPNPVVVELYTSQGCSSCPPADKILNGLAKRDDVIALALHVDYWDYIGWKDSFADPAFSKRQRAYARFAGARTVYTPQMIVGGMDHIIGIRPAEVDALIRRFAARPAPVTLSLGRSGGTVRVKASASAPLPRGSVVQVVRYKPTETVSIERGENAGKTIDYANIVTDWRQAADWDGTSDLLLDLKAPGGDPVVIIIQEPGPGPILAAAALR